MKTVLCITDAGGGHRASAEAVAEHLKEYSHDFEIVNIYTQIFKTKDEDVYNNLVLKKGLGFIYWPIIVPLFKLKIKLRSKYYESRLTKYFQKNPCDQVVSLLPFFNDILSVAVNNAEIKKFKILCTDFDEPTKNYWLTKQPPLAYFFPKKNFNEALPKPFKTKVISNDGVVIKPKFFETKPAIKADKKVGLMMMGGYASNLVFKLLKAIDSKSTAMVVICGHNNQLLQKIQNTTWQGNIQPLGFVNNVEQYMQSAHYFVGKPGPGSVQEAIACKLPVLILHNKSTMKQELSVVNEINALGTGLTFNSTNSFKIVFSKLMNNYEEYATNVAKYKLENPQENLKNFIEL